MANGSVKFPISFPPGENIPASGSWPSPLSPRAYARIQMHVHAQITHVQIRVRSRSPSIGDANHESRIGRIAVKGAMKGRGCGRQRRNTARNFCYPSLTLEMVLVHAPWETPVSRYIGPNSSKPEVAAPCRGSITPVAGSKIARGPAGAAGAAP